LKIENCKMKIANWPYSMHVGLSVESPGSNLQFAFFNFHFAMLLVVLLLPFNDHSTRPLTFPGTDTVLVTQK